MIINPNYFHQVTKIEGKSPNFLGMFVGSSKTKQIVKGK